MSYNRRDNNQLNPELNHDGCTNPLAMRKSILRNPEMPLNEPSQMFNKGACASHLKAQGGSTILHHATHESSKPVSSSSRDYREPRLNKISEMRKNLEDLKQFQADRVNELHDLSKSTQMIISSKLNFPSRTTVFKNLTKLDDKEELPVVPRKSYGLPSNSNALRKSGGSELSTNLNKAGIKEEIELINKLVDSDYEEVEKNVSMASQLVPMPSEENFLGFNAFSKPDYSRLKHRKTSNVYFKSVQCEINKERYKADFCESSKVNMLLEKRLAPTAYDTCKCLSDFNSQPCT